MYQLDFVNNIEVTDEIWQEAAATMRLLKENTCRHCVLSLAIRKALPFVKNVSTREFCCTIDRTVFDHDASCIVNEFDAFFYDSNYHLPETLTFSITRAL